MMRVHTLASCLWALAHARSSLSNDWEGRGNLATSSRGASWLEIDALVVIVPEVCAPCLPPCAKVSARKRVLSPTSLVAR